jgi:hypothetical protein
MPIHRSITRINSSQDNDAAITVCCSIFLAYIILSMILTSYNVDSGIIFLIVFGSFGTGTCIICCCLKKSYTDYGNNNNNNNEEHIPTISAYPISDHDESFQDLVPVICTPVVE